MEKHLRASLRRVNEKKASFYPQISLTGNLETASPGFLTRRRSIEPWEAWVEWTSNILAQLEIHRAANPTRVEDRVGLRAWNHLFAHQSRIPSMEIADDNADKSPRKRLVKEIALALWRRKRNWVILDYSNHCMRSRNIEMQSTGSAPGADDRHDLRVHAGHWLRSRREERGLSQRELAEKVGALYYTFISQIESGKGRIPPERYESWAEALDVDVREFCIKMLSFYEPTTHRILFERA